MDGMFDSTEYIVANAPYPAFSALTVRSMLSIAQRKGLKNKVQERYDSQLADNPNDRTALTIMESFASSFNRDYLAAAEMYESLAKEDDDFQSYCLMEAASCWQREGSKEKTLQAARAADKIGPDKRARRSLYQWHRTLADLFLLNLQREPAIKHFELALEEANIDAYRQQCRDQLALTKALRETDAP